MLTEGRYGAINANPTRELACIVTKLRQRDIQFTQSAFMAAAMRKEGSISEYADNYINSLYSEYQAIARKRDKFMRQQLESLSEVDWSKVLSINPEMTELYSQEDLLGQLQNASQ